MRALCAVSIFLSTISAASYWVRNDLQSGDSAASYWVRNDLQSGDSAASYSVRNDLQSGDSAAVYWVQNDLHSGDPRSLAVRRHPALVCRPSHHAFFSSVPVLPPGRVPGQLRHPGPDVQSQPPAPPDQDPVAHLLHHVLHRPVSRAGARQLPVAAERRPARPGQHHPHRAAVHDSREGGAAQQGQARAAAQTPQVPIGPRKVQAAEQVQAERWASVCLDVRLSRCPSV